jgi:hypothetical protein
LKLFLSSKNYEFNNYSSSITYSSSFFYLVSLKLSLPYKISKGIILFSYFKSWTPDCY